MCFLVIKSLRPYSVCLSNCLTGCLCFPDTSLLPFFFYFLFFRLGCPTGRLSAFPVKRVCNLESPYSTPRSLVR